MRWVISAENKLRPCKAKIKKSDNYKNALFHGWISDSEAIVELENGKIHMVHPENIIFLDHPFNDYSWEDNGGCRKDA